MAPFLKLLLFVTFAYVIVTLVRFIIRAGRMADERRKQQNVRGEGRGPGRKNGDIELDKDDYKVE